MGDRRQIDIPNTVTELTRDANRDLNGETGLPGAAGSGQGHQPVAASSWRTFISFRAQRNL
jgi:hypothetical protein